MSRWLILLLLSVTPAFGQNQQNCPIKRVKVEGCNPNNQSACYMNRPVCETPAKVEEKKSKKSQPRS
jgi:hypothetical protein